MQLWLSCRKVKWVYWESAKGYYPQLIRLRKSPLPLKIRSSVLSVYEKPEEESFMDEISFLPRSAEVDKREWFPLGELILLLADYLVPSKIVFKAAIAVVCLLPARWWARTTRPWAIPVNTGNRFTLRMNETSSIIDVSLQNNQWNQYIGKLISSAF